MKPQTAIRPWIVNHIGSRLLAGRHPHSVALTLTLALLVGLTAGVCSPAHAGYNYRKALTIQGSKVTGALSDFPVLVSITDPDLQAHVNNVDGYDIVFKDSDGATLSHEIESYTPATGTLTAWVKVPALQPGVNTIIYVYYGDSTISTPTQTASAVWDASFKGVWHFKDKESSDPFKDSTSRGNHGVDNITMLSQPGKIGKGLYFSGTNNYIDIGDKSDFDFGTSDFTASFWVKTNKTQMNIMGKRVDCSASYSFWKIAYNNSGIFLESSEDGGANYYGVQGDTTFYNNAWHLITVQRYGGTTVKYYVDGTLDETLTYPSQNLSNTASFRIGGDNACTGNFIGRLDEVRISNTQRSADWIKTEYKNQNAPGAFIAVGAEENIGLAYFRISAFAGSDGAISPAGETTVEAGLNQTYTVTPNSGYRLTALTVDGVAASLTNGQYTFTHVDRDHTIVASFQPIVSSTPPPPPAGGIIPGCGQNSTVNYNNTAGFNAANFNLIASEVDPSTHWLMLKRDPFGADNPTFIVPFSGSLKVTEISYCSWAPASDFGWMYASDLPADGSQPDRAKMHNIYTDMQAAAGYDAHCSQVLKGFEGGPHGNVLDNRVTTQTFNEGDELVFWLNVDYTGMNEYIRSLFVADGVSTTPKYYYSKKEWNQDVYNHPNQDQCAEKYANPGYFDKTIEFSEDSADNGKCRLTTGLMNPCTTLDQFFKDLLKLKYAGVTKKLPIVKDQKYQHMIAALSNNKPNELVLGWEEQTGGGETDFNDHVLHIEGLGGGLVKLKNPIIPISEDYITALDVTVWDRIPPCTVGPTAPFPIKYFVSINNGSSWKEITSWDEVWQTDASKNDLGQLDPADWTPGSPEYTRRSFHVDFAGLGITGREVLWKAEFRTASLALDCAMPAIIDVQLRADGVLSGNFSRGAPVVKANVIYSGYYQTPATNWLDKSYRGHLTATKIYNPDYPKVNDDPAYPNIQAKLWDAGEMLTATDPAARTIYCPEIAVGDISDTLLFTGDGVKQTFTGTLTPHPITATSLRITDGREIFIDKQPDLLEGDRGSSGTINRFTGAFSLTFDNVPDINSPITASYHFYQSKPAVMTFDAAHITKSVMGLDDPTNASNAVYNFDGSADGAVTDNDAHLLMDWVKGYALGTQVKREWLLGAIDHSVPALVTPPGLPQWYFGTATTKQERQSIETFITANAARPTVLFAGSRDGMLHAFNAGSFRHGDNPCTPSIKEQRGYFKWASQIDPTCTPIPETHDPDYGDGSELWAFIPANLLPRLKNNLLAKLGGQLGDNSQAYVDASPAVADVYTDGVWRTVLLSAEGNGGDTVFCLDITDPLHPNFLWEFADPYLFRSRSSPSVGKIGRILVNGSAKWVAFFVSGGDTRYNSSQFPSVYMIDVATGSVIERFLLNCEPLGKGGVPSGQPTVIDSDGNGYVDRFYIGTDKGYLYKVNIPDDPDSPKYHISHCVVNTEFTDATGATVDSSWQYQPIYGSPVAVVDNGIKEDGNIDYNVKIFFGTGDSPYAEDINAAGTRYHFYAYKDSSRKGECSPDKVSLDWFYKLPDGQRVFSSAFAAAGTIYFGTSTANTEDPCAGGGLQSNNQGELFAFDMKLPEGLTQPVQPKYRTVVGNMVSNPVVEDNHIYVKAPGQGTLSLGAGIYNNEVLFGGWPTMRVLSWKEIWSSPALDNR